MLAAVCGLAGLAFGAWMDVYQWTLAARQDLDTYVAVAGTSLPYNLAHAVGNVVFCLLIGPAFLRALARYRRRLEVRWERTPAPVALGAVAVALAPARPGRRGGRHSRAAGRGATSLKAQNKDGGFGADAGGGSSPLYTGWAGLGLGSAGRNPRDVKRAGGRSLARYVLRDPGSLSDIGEIERTVLLAKVAGLSPRELRRAQPDRRDPGPAPPRRLDLRLRELHGLRRCMALRAAGAPAGGSTVRWLVSSQNSDGGFGVARSVRERRRHDRRRPPGARRRSGAAAAHGRAARRPWLVANQNGDGGFGQFKGRPSNAQSTAYAVQGLIAAGAGGGAVSRARSYLVRLQRGDGSVAYSSSSTQTPVWVTAQALMALAGQAAADRRPRRAGSSRRRGEPAPRTAAGAGQPRRGGGHERGGWLEVRRRRGRRRRRRRAARRPWAPRAARPPPASPCPSPRARPPRRSRSRRATQGATEAPEPVPVWAAILAALGLLGAVLRSCTASCCRAGAGPRLVSRASARAIMRSITRSGSTFAIRARSFASRPTR